MTGADSDYDKDVEIIFLYINHAHGIILHRT